MSSKKPTFTQFPKFTKLTYAHREEWNSLIADYPPFSEYSFATLMNWWSSLENCKVALINENVVISYWIPGDEHNSGLSFIGTRKVDESICAIFDWQRENGYKPRLVHVPEFVIERIRYPNLFNFDGERGYDECILKVERFANKSKLPPIINSRVKRFLAEISEGQTEVKELNINDTALQRELLVLVDDWKGKGGFNDVGKFEQETLIYAITNAELLEYSAIGLYINGALHSFVLYLSKPKTNTAIVGFGRFSYEFLRQFEYSVYKFAEWLKKEGIKFVNIEADFDNPVLRASKLVLGVHEYLRKYSIKPKQ